MSRRGLFLSLLLCGGSAAAETFTAKADSVVDAETLVVSRGGRSDVIRLKGVITPLEGQPGFAEAKAFSTSFALPRSVTVRCTATLDACRGDALVNGKSLREALVGNGLARWDSAEEPDNAALKALEDKARSEKRGQWAKGEFLPAVEPPPPSGPGILALRRGRTGTLKSLGLTVLLMDVRDGRCPETVQCVSAGEITALLRVSREGSSPAEISAGWLGEAHSVGEYAGLSFRLVRLSPAPGPADGRFQPDRHTVFLDVTPK